jgi:hypothetical protein
MGASKRCPLVEAELKKSRALGEDLRELAEVGTEYNVILRSSLGFNELCVNTDFYWSVHKSSAKAITQSPG